MMPQVDLFLFVFWKNSKTPKEHFEINLPLKAPNLSIAGSKSIFNCRFQTVKDPKQRLKFWPKIDMKRVPIHFGVMTMSVMNLCQLDLLHWL